MKHLLTGLWLQRQQQAPLTRLFLLIYFGGLVISLWKGSILLLLINVIGATAMMVSAVQLTYHREGPFLTPGMRQAEIGAAIFTCSLLTWLPLLVHVGLSDDGLEVIASGLLLAGVLLVASAFSEIIIASLMLATLPLLWARAALPETTEQFFGAVFQPGRELALAYLVFGFAAYLVFAWRIRRGEPFRPLGTRIGIEKEVMLLDRFSRRHRIGGQFDRLRAVVRGAAPAAVMEWLIFAYALMFALLFAFDFSRGRADTLGTELALCFVFYLVSLFAWTRELSVEQLWLSAGFRTRRGAAFAVAADQLYRDLRLLIPALAVVTWVCLIQDEPYLDLPLRLAGSILFAAAIKLVGDFRLWLLGLFFVLVLAGALAPIWFAGGCLIAWLGLLGRFLNNSRYAMPRLAADSGHLH